MKRGTPTHPKTLALASALGVERWGAVGLLESLWHFAAQYARRGDLGRHSDAAIAAGVGWTGDPEALVSALVSCGWLDECACHRLRVHDWKDHADRAVPKTQEVKNQGFIECYDDTRTRVARVSHACGSEPATALAQGTGHRAPAQGNGGRREAAAKRSRSKPSRETWLTPYGEAWQRRWGEDSKPPWSELAGALRDAHEKHGEATLCRAWEAFLAQAERSAWARPVRFVQGLGEWLGTALPALPRSRASPGAQVDAGVDRLMRKAEAAAKRELPFGGEDP